MSSSGSSETVQKRRRYPSSRCLIHSFLGTAYALTQNRNFDNFLRGIGVGKETRQTAVNLKPIVKLTKRQREYTLTTVYGDGRVSKISFELEKPMVRELKNGLTVTSLFLVKGNKLEETQCTDELTIIVTRTFGPEHVVVSMSTNKEKCQRFYKRLRAPGDDDIRTETSRRSISSTGSEGFSDGFSTESEIEIHNIKPLTPRG